MAKERLVGSDGKLVTVLLGTALVGDGIQTLDELAGGAAASGAGEGWYEIATISDGTSIFPAGLSVGDLWWDDGTALLDSGSTADDSVKPLDETVQADITSFNLDVSRSEIDVTVLEDDVMRYRSGKIDMTGSMEGITILGVTDNDGWIVNNFLRVIEQAAAGTVTVKEIDDAEIYIKGVLQKDMTSGEKDSFFWAKINILSSSLGASGENAQTFSASYRIAPGDPTPTMYIREIA